MPAHEGVRADDDVFADLADRIVHVARKLSAHQYRDPQVVPLSPLEAMVLRHVDRNPGITSTQLADDLELRSSNASTVLRSLVAKELLARMPDPEDRRAAHFALTDTARDSVVRLRAEWSKTLRAMLPDTIDPHAALGVLEALDDAGW